MKYAAQIVMMLLLCGLGAWARQQPGHAETKAVTLVSGLGDLHHPVTTSNPEAQKFFDQGLRYMFAFNHEEAGRSFQRAAELDPKLAMAYWGMALAVGPNYNDPGDPDRFKVAHDAAQKAASLAQGATPNERGYIAALVLRFPGEANADLRHAAEQYRDAMRNVTKQFPDDLDAATLFAEAGMLLHPWGLWHPDGTAEVGTAEIVSSLESVLRRDPNHIGAIHYYIHAVEASPNPERALAPAGRLAALAPAAGHLVHMPGHVYIRTGDFESAIKTNQKAAEADRAYQQASGGQGMYLAMYYSHNLHFIAACASMDGDYAEARKAAAMLAAHVGPLLKDMPPLEAFMTVPIAVEVRFHKWDQILALPQPDPAMLATTSVWHFARGMAFAGKGRITEAETEYKILADAEANTPPDVIFAAPINNKTKDILKIAENVLGAEIAIAKHDPAAALARLRQAVTIQDSLNYDEPPDWSYPVRETLGGVLLATGKAAEAEKTFREDLDLNPRNPRSLFGLRESLKAQGRGYDAQFVDKQFQSAWKSSAVLKAEDLI
jgi:tetratricopeptide (TPR) repeat protein